MNVGTTPVNLPGGYPLIQNLGPDPLYIGDLGTVTPATGVKLAPGQSFTAGGRGGGPWVVSSGTSDVRLAKRGTGIF